MWAMMSSWCTQQSRVHILWDILYTLYPLNYTTLTALNDHQHVYDCPRVIVKYEACRDYMYFAAYIDYSTHALIWLSSITLYPNREIPLNSWCTLIGSSGSAAWPQSCIYCFYACYYSNLIERAHVNVCLVTPHVHVCLDTRMFQLHISNALLKYTQEPKYRNYDEMFAIGCNGSFHLDRFPAASTGGFIDRATFPL